MPMYPPQVHRSHLTPLRFLQRSAAVFREKPAVIHGDRVMTYPELNERVHRLASALRAAGVAPGDRVACLLPNIPQMLEAHFGVPLAGGILVAINTRLAPDEIAYILNHSGAEILLVDTELAPLVEPVLSQLTALETIVSVEDVPGGLRLPGPDYEAFLASGSADPIDWPLEDEDETIAVDYTSGTTGRPKGVMYTHRGAYLNSLGELLETRMSADSVYLWTLPMFHCNGWCYPWAVTAIGATHICLRKLEPARVWELIRERGVTHFCAAPTVLIALVNAPEAPTEPLGRPLIVSTAAAPPSPTIIRQVEALGVEIVHVYGLTEVYGPYTVCAWQPHWDALPEDERARLKARQGVGYLIADDARVVDGQMRDVPADGATLGEVIMRGNNTMKGYYNDPATTETAFRGGWFHSGDLAVMHPDGYIELRDREKDIIISGGENISTIEVEQVICAHPDVLEAAVIAIPDDFWGEAPKAFVALKPGHALTADELIAHCRGKLAGFKIPRAVAFGELPKSSTGKVQKFALREREWAG
ncbi:MAG: long-chain-fatty-acid--CoA ligase, partial [Thermomicrobiales bacterium]|nr:long-chain-fatty-acid--CoA ligase [Thermomicrobiales bacterium]